MERMRRFDLASGKDFKVLLSLLYQVLVDNKLIQDNESTLTGITGLLEDYTLDDDEQISEFSRYLYSPQRRLEYLHCCLKSLFYGVLQDIDNPWIRHGTPKSVFTQAKLELLDLSKKLEGEWFKVIRDYNESRMIITIIEVDGKLFPEMGVRYLNKENDDES